MPLDTPSSSGIFTLTPNTDTQGNSSRYPALNFPLPGIHHWNLLLLWLAGLCVCYLKNWIDVHTLTFLWVIILVFFSDLLIWIQILTSVKTHLDVQMILSLATFRVTNSCTTSQEQVKGILIQQALTSLPSLMSFWAKTVNAIPSSFVATEPKSRDQE